MGSHQTAQKDASWSQKGRVYRCVASRACVLLCRARRSERLPSPNGNEQKDLQNRPQTGGRPEQRLDRGRPDSEEHHADRRLPALRSCQARLRHDQGWCGGHQEALHYSPQVSLHAHQALSPRRDPPEVYRHVVQ
eukprot:223368_1